MCHEDKEHISENKMLMCYTDWLSEKASLGKQQ